VKLPARLTLVLGILLLLAFAAHRWRVAHRESSQDKNILAAAQKYGVDPALIKGVIWRESRFDPHARGSKGEVGLMQIMEDTGLEWAGAQRLPNFSKYTLLNANKNVDCGAWYLRRLLARYTRADDPVPYALADYNAGRANVLKWIEGEATTNSSAFIQRIGFPSTRQYVRAVMQRRQKYARDFVSRQQ
jgi:soluble lytic murein transglycosylase